MHDGVTPSVAPPSEGHDTVVAVVGLGKIGMPLAVCYARQGHRVIGCDVNPHVVETVNAGRCHVQEEPGLEAEVARLVARHALSATLDTTAAVHLADVVVVIVPVVVNARHEVDYRALDAATAAVAAGLGPDKLVIYETTLPVGTTARRLRCALEDGSHLRAGPDFLLAYSPERVSSGHIFRDLATYPKVVGGIDEASAQAAVAFYRSVLEADVITMPSTNDAEFVKLIETTYRDVNIALANEFARYADTRGLDVHAAITAANTQPYSHVHDPSVGVGGHCIPVYPYFLLQDASDGLSLPRQARGINDGMAEYAMERLEAVVGPLAGQLVLILGAAYRGDVREPAFSTARLLQEALEARDACVAVLDPLFGDDEMEALGYPPLKPEDAAAVSAIIVQAGHRAFTTLDFAEFPRCKVVLDGRRALCRERIVSMGMAYLAIGDGQYVDARSR